MRPQPDQPRRPSRRARRSERRARSRGRGRVIIGVGLAVLFFLLISLRGIASFYTDYLWFHSLDLAEVWRRVLTTKITLTLAGGVIFFLLCWGNLLVADRVAPVFRPPSGDDDLIERYHQVIGRRAWLVRVGAALLMALVVGANLGAAWNDWILFTHRVDFGQRDATFHTDIGFYVFQLPFLSAASAWLFSSLIVILIMVVLAHIMNGGIRFNTQLDRTTPQVKAHISVLLGVLALVQMGRYWLSRYELTFSTNGTVDGATYTDVNVRLRAIYLLMLIALFAFGLFIANIWRRGWILPGMAVGLWMLVAVVAGGIVPAFVQRFRVQPTESTMERPYITNNISATRDAYGLGDVKVTPWNWTDTLTADQINSNPGTMENVRLWDPASMQASFRADQEMKSFYGITDVDVDRYRVDNQTTQVMIAARDLKASGIERPSWESTHLIYTNGLGVVAATANDKTSGGDPNLVVQDLDSKPSGGMPSLTEPRIFIGERQTSYVIVNTDVKPQGADPSQVADYTGKDGITIGSGTNGFLRKAAFSLRFGDIDPLVSGSIRPDSKLLMERDVTSRVKAVAPFLAYDHDPYPVITDKGHLVYVLDAYTTTRNYPNAQRADTGGLSASSGLANRSFNYVRNSVKAVVDAYDGTVTLYVVHPEDDPLIRAYQKAFPTLFTSVDKAPEYLKPHLRYPEDLFTVQTQMWARYHEDNADDFYNGRNNWAVPKDAGATKKSGNKTTQLGVDGQELTAQDRYPSQYVLMQLPGSSEASFVLLRPYVTASENESDAGQNQLRSFIVASSDPGSYGELQTFTVDASQLPDGPNLAADDIKADDAVAAKIKDQCTDSKVCTFNAPQIVPVNDSLLYVQSFLVSASSTSAPHLNYVIVNYRRPDNRSEVAIDTTLHGALVKIFGNKVSPKIEGGAIESPANDPNAPPEGTISLTQQESDLIDAIVQAFDDADSASRKGNLELWVQKLEEARQLASQLQDLRARIEREATGTNSGSAPTTTTTTPSSSSTTTTTTTSPPSTTTTAPASTTTTSAGA